MTRKGNRRQEKNKENQGWRYFLLTRNKEGRIIIIKKRKLGKLTLSLPGMYKDDMIITKQWS
jgi:hypothetical protein